MWAGMPSLRILTTGLPRMAAAVAEPSVFLPPPDLASIFFVIFFFVLTTFCSLNSPRLAGVGADNPLFPFQKVRESSKRNQIRHKNLRIFFAPEKVNGGGRFGMQPPHQAAPSLSISLEFSAPHATIENLQACLTAFNAGVGVVIVDALVVLRLHFVPRHGGMRVESERDITDHVFDEHRIFIRALG